MITVKDAGMQNVSYCQITSIKKMSSEVYSFSPNFCKMFIENFFWMVDVEKLRTIILNMARVHKLLVEKDNCVK